MDGRRRIVYLLVISFKMDLMMLDHTACVTDAFGKRRKEVCFQYSSTEKGVVVGVCALWSVAGLAKTRREKRMQTKQEGKTDV